MDNNNQPATGVSSYQSSLDPRTKTDEPYELFNLEMSDDQLVKMLVNGMNDDVSHWEQKPWLLKRTDTENIAYLLGDQIDDKYLLPFQTKFIDNRLFSSVRAILSYATGQLAKPEVLPSKVDDRYRRIAKDLETVLYQHALDHKANHAMRMAVRNLIVRKRGCLKLRYDPDAGPFGDIITENVDPSDIIIDRYAKFGGDPNKIYHRQKCTVEALVAKFPDKQKEIFDAFNFKRGTYSQMSRIVTYYECWFSYYDSESKKRQGLCWFIPDNNTILGKMDNPNWIKKGNDTHQKVINLMNAPPKPFIWLNYLNTGRSFIDETCLFDQAMPMQDILNKRGRQITENADYANPRMLVDKRVMEESDAKKFVNKHPKTIGLVDTTQTANDIGKAVMQIPGAMLPAYVIQDKMDARNEIDEIMATPSQTRGGTTTGNSRTLGQDLMAKNGAFEIQDDIVGVVNHGFADYYTLLLQMMRVFLPDDYWLMTKGSNGEFIQITLTDDNLDTNVRVSVQTDSSLPLDKESQRATAVQLAQMPGRLDDLSLFEMLGLPEPEKLAERVQRFNIDRYTYMESIEQKLFNAQAEADIAIITAGKVPEERDDYTDDYMNYWNRFLTTNRFQKLKPNIQQALTTFLHAVANKAALTEGLRDSMLNPAGIIDRPPIMPLPKRTMNIRLMGNMDPQTTQTIAGGEAQMAVPLSQLQAAQRPANQGNPQVGQQAGQPSPPKVNSAPQFGP